MRVLSFILVMSFVLGCSKIITPTSYQPSSYSLTGVVQLARVRNASVKVYALNSDGTEGSLIAQTTTNSQGEFSFTLPRTTGSVIVKSSGGKFDDEAEQVEKDASELSAVSQGGANNLAALTPMSTLESERVKALLGSGSNLTQAKNTAKTEVARLFGLSTSDLSVLPDAPTALSLNSSKVKSALSIAAFSHFVKDFYLSVLNSNTKLSSIMTAMKDDFKSDGKLDGSTNSNTAKKIAALWSSKMSAAKTQAAANSALGFLNQNASVINSVSDFDSGDSTLGQQADGYYLKGVKTTLNSQGNGVWLDSCFVSGADTEEMENGTGTCSANNLYYRDGALASGFFNSTCYLEGVNTGEVVSGTGTCSVTGKYYESGSLANGVYNSICYASGVDNGGLVGGIGTCSVTGKYYVGGSLANGVYNSICYASGVDNGGLVSGNGTCSVTGKYYVGGSLANGVYNSICYSGGVDNGNLVGGTGTCSINGKYYVSGSLANGVYDSVCYSNGSNTGGLVSGTGSCSGDGKYYVGGTAANGVYNSICYLGGVDTGALVGGTGSCSADGKYYVSGSLASGVYNSICYSSGVETLDLANGSGICSADGLRYENSQLAYGWLPEVPGSMTNFYFVAGEKTNLNSSGNGEHNGFCYNLGSPRDPSTVQHYTFHFAATGDLSSLSNYQDEGSPAYCFPDSNDAVTINSFVNSGSLTAGTISIPTSAVDGGTLNGTVTFGAVMSGYGVMSAGTINGNVNFTNGSFYIGGTLNGTVDWSGGLTGVFSMAGSPYDGKYFYHGRYAQFADGAMADGKYYVDGSLASGLISGHYYVDGIISEGCTDALACNYNPSAAYDDGSCSDTCGTNTTYLVAPGDADSAVADSTSTAGNYAWLAYRGLTYIQKRDITNGDWVSNIELPNYAGSALLFRVGEYVWALGNPNGPGAWRIHRSTDSVTDFSSSIPNITTATSSEGFLWALGSETRTLYKINGVTGSIVATKDLSDIFSYQPQAIAADANRVGITGDSQLVFLYKTDLTVERTITLPDSNLIANNNYDSGFTGFDPAEAHLLREGEGGWFLATGWDRSDIYRYDFASDSGFFLNVTIDSIEGIARDATGFWIPNTHNYIEAAYLYHIRFDGAVDRRLNMGSHYGFATGDGSGYWYPKAHISPGGRLWQINYGENGIANFRLLIMDWMSDGSSPSGSCGDYMCDSGETNQTCSADCPSQ